MAKKKKKAANGKITILTGMEETQALILSAAVIGVRVILKFCKGEFPNTGRLTVLKRALKIADLFEKRGVLKDKKICYFFHEGYLFRCRVYKADELGEIILPEYAYALSFFDEPEEYYNLPPVTSYLLMPPLMENTGGAVKKQAANLIMQYELE